MLIKLFLLFAIIPLIELYLLLKLASITGVATTIAIVVVTAILGSLLAKTQGWLAWWRFRSAMLEGRMPGQEIADGLLIAFAAALLLTPGLLTDFVGFLLLIPVSRGRVREWLLRSIANQVQVRMTVFPGPDGEPFETRYEYHHGPGDSRTIDGQVRHHETENLDSVHGGHRRLPERD